MSGAQPLAVTLNEGVVIDVEVRSERVERKVSEGYCDRMTASLDEALGLGREGQARAALRSALGWSATPPTSIRRSCARGVIPDLVSDQTPAHDLGAYVPQRRSGRARALRESRPRRVPAALARLDGRHVEAILEMQRRGAVAFDYGNNLRGQAEKAGVECATRAARSTIRGSCPRT